MVREIKREPPSGFLVLGILFVGSLAVSYWMVDAIQAEAVPQIVGSSVVASVVFVLWLGFFMVNPNEARILQLFGLSVGRVRLGLPGRGSRGRRDRLW